MIGKTSYLVIQVLQEALINLSPDNYLLFLTPARARPTQYNTLPNCIETLI